RHTVTHSGTSTATRPAVRRDTEGSRDPSLCGRAIEWKDGVGLFGRGTAGHGPESRRWWGNGRVRHRRHQFLPAQSDRTHGYAIALRWEELVATMPYTAVSPPPSRFRTMTGSASSEKTDAVFPLNGSTAKRRVT